MLPPFYALLYPAPLARVNGYEDASVRHTTVPQTRSYAVCCRVFAARASWTRRPSPAQIVLSAFSIKECSVSAKRSSDYMLKWSGIKAFCKISFNVSNSFGTRLKRRLWPRRSVWPGIGGGRAMRAGAKAAPVFTGYTAPWAGSLPWPVYRRLIQGSAGGNGFWGMATA